MLPLLGRAQKKSDLLKKQEKALIQKIQNTKLLIDQSRANEKLTLSELTIINKQINYRERLIRNYNFQLKKMDESIGKINRQINALSNTEKTLKQEYKKMLVYAFKNRDPNYKYLYIHKLILFKKFFISCFNELCIQGKLILSNSRVSRY